MSLHIEDPEIERLASEVAAATGETKTEAIQTSLRERKERLALPSVEERVKAIMEKMDRELLPLMVPERRGKPFTQEEQNEILGYGPDGYCV